MIEAVVFDLDGTLIDSEAVAFATGREIFGPHSPVFDADFFHALVGVDDATARIRITEALPAGTSFETIHGAWRRAIRARFIAEGVPLKPGARESLERLKTLGFPIAIATSSLEESATFKLDRAGIAGYFAEVVVRESIVSPKPAPDAYLEAARRLGIAPERCLALEDSTLGAQAAWSAGMRVIQIPDVVAPKARPEWEIAPDLLTALQIAGLA